MLYLWIFGDNVEDTLGHGRFLVFYLLSGVAAALVQTMVSPASAIPMVGASGAVSGVLGAYLLLFPHARVLTLLIFGFFFRMVHIPGRRRARLLDRRAAGQRLLDRHHLRRRRRVGRGRGGMVRPYRRRRGRHGPALRVPAAARPARALLASGSRVTSAILNALPRYRRGPDRDPPARGDGDEGSHHGRRLRDPPAPADHPHPQAAGAGRQRADHGAHRPAPEAARLHRPAGAPLLPARDHHRLLRGRQPLGRAHDLRDAHRRPGHRGRGQVRRRRARRAGARDLRRRADGLRPRRRGAVASRARRRSHHGAHPGGLAARLRHRDHGRERTHRPLPREALLGRGLQRHDQYRHLHSRPRRAGGRPRRPALRFRQGAVSRAAGVGPPPLRPRRGRLLARRGGPHRVPDRASRSAPAAGGGGHSRHPHRGARLQRLGGRGRPRGLPREALGLGDHRPRRPGGRGSPARQLRDRPRFDDRRRRRDREQRALGPCRRGRGRAGEGSHRGHAGPDPRRMPSSRKAW